jgi:hypothetical protein
MPAGSPTLAATQAASPAATPQLVSFPTQAPTNVYATALLRGQLIVGGHCLWVVSNNGGNYPISWPYGYSWSVEDGVIQVLDESGVVVVRVGDEIELSGGEGPATRPGDACLAAGDAWYVGDLVRTAAAAAVPTATPTPPDIVFPQTTAPSQGDAELVGTLVLSAGCLRIEARDASTSYLVIWPPGVTPRSENESIVLHVADHWPVGWLGAELFLTGEAAAELPSGLAVQQLPSECPGPYWIAGADVQPVEYVARDGEPAQLRPTDSIVPGAIDYAATYRPTLAEAVRRLVLQGQSGPIVGNLTLNARDSFAGFWVEHEPVFKFVALFTHDGEQTLRPYVVGTPLEGLIEVRNGARWTESDLEAQQAEATNILGDLGFNPSSATDVRENRVTVWIANREAVEAALEAAGLQLPAAVELIESNE